MKTNGLQLNSTMNFSCRCKDIIATIDTAHRNLITLKMSSQVTQLSSKSRLGSLTTHSLAFSLSLFSYMKSQEKQMNKHNSSLALPFYNKRL